MAFIFRHSKIFFAFTYREREKDGKLVGLVYPDYDAVDHAGISHQDLPEVLEQTRIGLNKLLAPYEAVTALKLYPNEFEKTPKKSIKRYLYTI